MMLKTLIASVAVIAVSLTAILIQTDGFQAFTSENKRRLSIRQQPQAVVDVVFENQRSEAIRWDDFRGKYILVDFIYTQCETVCLALGAQFFQTQQQAADLIESDQLQLLSVSFDGERDSPQQLQDYLDRFTDDTDSWMAVRTSSKEQQQLLNQFGVIALADGLGGYIHNAALHLVSPDGELMEIIDYQDAMTLIADLRKRLQHNTNLLGSNR